MSSVLSSIHVRAISVLIAAFVSFSVHAKTGDDYSGNWAGQGIYSDPEIEILVPISFRIDIQLTADQLHIEECWAPLIDFNLKPACIKSDYEVQNNGDIYSRSRKIGDIYPDHIVILQSNSQVSEQMIFQLNGEHQMRYQYTYANVDGGSVFRKAVLK